VASGFRPPCEPVGPSCRVRSTLLTVLLCLITTNSSNDRRRCWPPRTLAGLVIRRPRSVWTTTCRLSVALGALCGVAHGRVGVLEDSGIVLTPGELDAFGFTPGVGEPNGGWADRGYRERRHSV